MQPERDHQFEGEHVGFGIQSNRKYRDTWPGGYFSFTLKVLPHEEQELVVSYTREIEHMNSFDLTIDGTRLENGKLILEEMNTFVLLKYEIPYSLTVAKDAVTIKFSAHQGEKVPKVFGIRMVKK
jgi:RNase P/RNase MRP subunit p29